MSRILFAVALAGSLAFQQAQANPRVFVSSSGSDANVAMNCTFAAPCRSFATALTVVDPGGEVLALDAAGYGAVTITKSVSILANPGAYAGIAASTGIAVTIATAGVNVILRGLNINGIGANTGISMSDGSSLTIENCVISNFTGSALLESSANPVNIRILNSTVRGNGSHAVVITGPGSLDMVNSVVTGNGGVGIFASNNQTGTLNAHIANTVSSQNAWGLVADVEVSATGTTKVDVTGSVAANNSIDGFRTQNLAGGTVILTVSGSSATGNAASGFTNTGGTFETTGNNNVRSNGTNLSGTITAISLN